MHYFAEISPVLYLQRFSYAYTGVVFDDVCRDTFVNASYKLDVTTAAIQTLQAYIGVGGGDAATTMALSVEDAARGAINTVSLMKGLLFFHLLLISWPANVNIWKIEKMKL